MIVFQEGWLFWELKKSHQKICISRTCLGIGAPFVSQLFKFHCEHSQMGSAEVQQQARQLQLLLILLLLGPNVHSQVESSSKADLHVKIFTLSAGTDSIRAIIIVQCTYNFLETALLSLTWQQLLSSNMKTQLILAKCPLGLTYLFQLIKGFCLQPLKCSLFCSHHHLCSFIEIVDYSLQLKGKIAWYRVPRMAIFPRPMQH